MALILGRKQGQGFFVDPEGPEPVEVIVEHIECGLVRLRVLYGFRNARNWQVDRVSVNSCFVSDHQNLKIGDDIARIKLVRNKSPQAVLGIDSKKLVQRSELVGDVPPLFQPHRIVETTSRPNPGKQNGIIGGPSHEVDRKSKSTT